VSALLTDRCELGPGFRVSLAELYQGFREWAERAGEEPLSKRALTERLEPRDGIDQVRTSQARYWSGLRLREAE
jgi:phage/plasmid-associated DNA primase